MRLPEGFARLSDDIGKRLREIRLASDDYGKMTMQEFADEIGISRETLSRVESGVRFPTYSTLEAIMGALNIEWHHIAYRGTGQRKQIPEYPEVCADVGNALRAGRKSEGLTLRDAEALTGISSSQLSRIERGQFERGGHVEIRFFDGVREFDYDTKVGFTHPALEVLAEIGGYDFSLGKRSLTE